MYLIDNIYNNYNIYNYYFYKVILFFRTVPNLKENPDCKNTLIRNILIKTILKHLGDPYYTASHS